MNYTGRDEVGAETLKNIRRKMIFFFGGLFWPGSTQEQPRGVASENFEGEALSPSDLNLEHLIHRRAMVLRPG